MATEFEFRLVTPTGMMFEGIVRRVTAVNPLGEFTVLADHINYITSLEPCLLSAELADGAFNHYVISGGLAEVKDGAMTALAPEAQEAKVLERDAASRELEAAEERINGVSFYEAEYEPAQRQLQLARARLRAAEIRSA